MNDLRSDEEQAEEIRKWIKEYGQAVVAGVIIGLIALVGWKLWSDHRQTQAEQASDRYMALMVAADAGRTAELEAALAELRDDYASTPYPDLAALLTARSHIENDNLPAAEALLRNLVTDARQKPVRQVAALRLARVLHAQGHHEDALAELDRAALPAWWTLLAEELRGDIYRAMGDHEKARSAYDRAILAAAGDVPEHLRMKLDATGGRTEGGQS